MEWDAAALFRFVDVVGVVGNGLLGGAVARAYRFDLMGFALVAIMSALGGGMLRDVLLNSGHPVALTDPAYLTGALVAAVIAYFVEIEGRLPRRALVLADLLALGCWAATGTIKASTLGLAPIPSVLLGVITAIGGGIVRDMLVGRIPTVFGGNPLYGSLAIVGSIEALLLHRVGLWEAAMGSSIATCLVFGLLARRLGWRLPEPVDFSLRSIRVPAVRERLRRTRGDDRP